MSPSGRDLRSYMIDGPQGPLEVLYRAARREPEAARGAAVVCHPHPIYGGTLHSRVVFHLARAFGEAGFATLRFNFRGVGRSAGVHDGGAGELDDVQAALDHIADLHPRRPLAVAGHSFGAWVGLRAGTCRPEVSQMVGVGLPVALYDFGFLGGARADLLVVQGERDPFGPAGQIRSLARALGARAVILPGADHFLRGSLPRLRGAVLEFLGTGGGGLERCPGKPPPEGMRN